MARPMPLVSPCAPWLCRGTSTPTGLARAATTRLVALRATTSMASSITPTGSTIYSSPPPWEGENYEPRNPMESALLSHDFHLQYVANVSNRAMPTFYVIAALWGGQEGSMMLWLWILALYSALVVAQHRFRNRKLMPYVISTLMTTTLLFLAMLVIVEDPFRLLPHEPRDGQGLNPLLQNPLMVIHPPNLYLGFVGFAVPFAFAIGALASGRLDTQWIRSIRRWTLVAWLFLGVGLLLGRKRAYVELGWGGYWAWDPVENASFMPWLTGTAFLHSVMIQE